MKLRAVLRGFIKWQISNDMLKDELTIDYEVAEHYLEETEKSLKDYGVLGDVKASALDCLKHIADPITYIHKRAEEKGLEVNGLIAFYLSRDIDYITGIASDFIEKHEL